MTAKVNHALRGGMFICPNGLGAPVLSSEPLPRQVGAALRLARAGVLEGFMASSCMLRRSNRSARGISYRGAIDHYQREARPPPQADASAAFVQRPLVSSHSSSSAARPIPLGALGDALRSVHRAL